MRTKNLINQFLNGLGAIVEKPFKYTIVLGYSALMVVVYCVNSPVINPSINCVNPELMDTLVSLGTSILLLGGTFFIIILIGMPRNYLLIPTSLMKIGLKNSMGEVPMIISYYTDVENSKVKVYEFDSAKIPLTEWDAKQEDIEAALNICIINMDYVDGNRIIQIKAVPAKGALPECIEWSDELLSEEDFEIVLGEGIAEPIKLQLNIQNSIMIGGSTGSGKTVLVKNILYQCIKKNADVYISDFKGGVDYSGTLWKKKATFVTTYDEVISCLDDIIEEMEYRKDMFLNFYCNNISVFNKKYDKKMKHIIFCIDEMAELMDKTGASKEKKATIDQIEAKLSTIARLGRAFGIHLVLCSQRTSADICPGSIKNNVDCRICGRADNVLSMLILDNTEASDKIRKNQRGRFLMNDGTLFQGYYQSEKDYQFDEFEDEDDVQS